jgi:hypothetical protein
MATFRERHGYKVGSPARDLLEDAPPRLRAFLRESLIEDLGMVGAYEALCNQADIVPDGSVLSWGANDARPEVSRLVEYLEWPDVFQMLEDLAGGRSRPERWAPDVNEVLARCGLAYEMNEDGEIDLWDPEGEELGTAGDEQEALGVLEGAFMPAQRQYRRALDALHGRPSDPEKAISEAFGALEAVTHIATGEKNFGPAIDSIFSGAEGWTKALAQSLKNLHGYASQLPGARHGRHKDPAAEIQEALYAVRACGAAIAYIAYLHRG